MKIQCNLLVLAGDRVAIELTTLEEEAFSRLCICALPEQRTGDKGGGRREGSLGGSRHVTTFPFYPLPPVSISPYFRNSVVFFVAILVCQPDGPFCMARIKVYLVADQQINCKHDHN